MLDFQELYETYASDVFRFAFWIAGISADAEDITSETFVRAWVRRDVIRTETLKAYLFAIGKTLHHLVNDGIHSLAFVVDELL